MREDTKVAMVLRDLELELGKAQAKHRQMLSPHEGYAIILEELDELWDHVKADTAYGPEARKEALQVAAMALRFILDLQP
jgi:hypothetical protein